MALNRGNGEVKVRIKDFDLPAWKDANLTTAKGKIKIGMGSINSSGGALKGAEWEEVICACYNMRSKGVSLDEAKDLLASRGHGSQSMTKHSKKDFRLLTLHGETQRV